MKPINLKKLFLLSTHEKEELDGGSLQPPIVWSNVLFPDESTNDVS